MSCRCNSRFAGTAGRNSGLNASRSNSDTNSLLSPAPSAPLSAVLTRSRGMCTSPGSFTPTTKVHTASAPCGGNRQNDTTNCGCGGAGLSSINGVFASNISQSVAAGDAILLNTNLVVIPPYGLSLAGNGVQVTYGGPYRLSFLVYSSVPAAADATVFLTVNGNPQVITAVPLIQGGFVASGIAILQLAAGDIVGLSVAGALLTLAGGSNNAILDIIRIR